MVVGILIALQINNWNASVKEHLIETNYLERLKLDLQQDTVILNNKILETMNQQVLYKEFVDAMYVTQVTKSEFQQLLETVIWNREDLILQNKTYAETTSSGKFANMTQGELKEKIRNYYILCEQSANSITEMTNTGRTIFIQIYPKFIKYYPELSNLFTGDQMFKDSGWKFINNAASEDPLTLESAAAFYYFKETIFEGYYREILVAAGDLLQALNS